MNNNKELNEVVISYEQAETFAYNIYNEICEFIKHHPEEYFNMLISKITTKADKIIITIDKIDVISDYKYKMCRYAE